MKVHTQQTSKAGVYAYVRAKGPENEYTGVTTQSVVRLGGHRAKVTPLKNEEGGSGSSCPLRAQVTPARLRRDDT